MKFDISKVSLPVLRETVGDPKWMRENQESLLKVLPQGWTRYPDLELPFGFNLKLHGCEWKEQDDLAVTLLWLAHLNLIEFRVRTDVDIKGLFVRRTPNNHSGGA
jgi:hypothetical protein